MSYHIWSVSSPTCTYLVLKESMIFQRVLTVGTKSKIPLVLPKMSETQADKYTKWPLIITRTVLPPGNYLDSIKQGT